MLHEAIVSAESTRYISRIQTTRVQAVLNRILGRCCTRNRPRPCYTNQLSKVQNLATCCRVKCWAKNRHRYHVTRCSTFRATLLLPLPPFFRSSRKDLHGILEGFHFQDFWANFVFYRREFSKNLVRRSRKSYKRRERA